MVLGGMITKLENKSVFSAHKVALMEERDQREILYICMFFIIVIFL